MRRWLRGSSSRTWWGSGSRTAPKAAGRRGMRLTELDGPGWLHSADHQRRDHEHEETYDKGADVHKGDMPPFQLDNRLGNKISVFRQSNKAITVLQPADG